MYLLKYRVLRLLEAFNLNADHLSATDKTTISHSLSIITLQQSTIRQITVL